jgi:hypothetical protein
VSGEHFEKCELGLGFGFGLVVAVAVTHSSKGICQATKALGWNLEDVTHTARFIERWVFSRIR